MAEELYEECGKNQPNMEVVRDLCRSYGIPTDLRGRVWQILLGVVNKKANLQAWADDDLVVEEQQIIRADVNRTRQSIEKFKSEKVQKHMEILLTIYCKRRSVKYTQGLNELLAPVLDLEGEGFDTSAVFNCFYAIVQRFLPNTLRGHDLKTLRRSLELLRILLRYHLPVLSVFLEDAGIRPDFYATGWLVTLFAGQCEMDVVHKLWDTIIFNDDPIMPYFIALALLHRAQDRLLSSDAETAAVELRQLTIKDREDVKEVVSLAAALSSSTPRSFRRTVHRATIQNEANEHWDALLSSCPALLVSPGDLGHLVGGQAYQIIDCRSSGDFQAGRLKGSTLLKAAPRAEDQLGAIAAALQDLSPLLKAAQESQRPICVLGDGKVEEEVTAAVCGKLIAQGMEKVCVLDGGFRSCVHYFQTAGAVEEMLEGDLVLEATSDVQSTRSSESGEVFTERAPTATEMAKEGLELATEGIIAVKEAAMAMYTDPRVAQAAEKTKQKAKLWGQRGLGMLSAAVSKATGKAAELKMQSERMLKKESKGKDMVQEPRFAIEDDEEDQGDGRGGGGGGGGDEDKLDIQIDSLINLAHWKEKRLTHVIGCKRLGPKGQVFPRYLIISEKHVMDLEAHEVKVNVGRLKAWHSLNELERMTLSDEDPELLTLIFRTKNVDKPRGYIYSMERTKRDLCVEAIEENKNKLRSQRQRRRVSEGEVEQEGGEQVDGAASKGAMPVQDKAGATRDLISLADDGHDAVKVEKMRDVELRNEEGKKEESKEGGEGKGEMKGKGGGKEDQHKQSDGHQVSGDLVDLHSERVEVQAGEEGSRRKENGEKKEERSNTTEQLEEIFGNTNIASSKKGGAGKEVEGGKGAGEEVEGGKGEGEEVEGGKGEGEKSIIEGLDLEEELEWLKDVKTEEGEVSLEEEIPDWLKE